LVYKAFIGNLVISIPLLIAAIAGTWVFMSNLNKKRAKILEEKKQKEAVGLGAEV